MYMRLSRAEQRTDLLVHLTSGPIALGLPFIELLNRCAEIGIPIKDLSKINSGLSLAISKRH